MIEHKTTYDGTDFTAVAACTCGWAELFPLKSQAAAAARGHVTAFTAPPVVTS